MTRLLLAVACALGVASIASGQTVAPPADPLVSNGALFLFEPGVYAQFQASATDLIQPAPLDPLAPSATVAPGADFPNLSATFEGVNFTEDAIANQLFQIPPDPSGAAGPNHVVATANTMIEWWNKGGTLQHRQTLQAFFVPLAPENVTFDPKVVFDAYAARFVVVTLVKTQATAQAPATPMTSRVLVAVSDDSDPNGTWYFHAINAIEMLPVPQLPPNPPAPGPHWADFPGLAVDEEAVYVTANMFSFALNSFGGVRLWIIPKASFYAGDATTAVRYNPYGDFPLTSAPTTTMPTMMLTPGPGAVGTFLMSYSGLTDVVGNEFLQVVRVDNPLGTASFRHQFIPVGDIENARVALPGAPQAGGSRRIATNDRRVSQSPVWRDGALYLAASTLPATGPDAGQVTVRWWRLNTSNLSTITVAESGTVGGEDIAPGTFTFFPSVAIDSSNDLAVGFAASGAGIFAGAYATGRLASDPPGAMRGATMIRGGIDYYVRAFNTDPASTVPSRWGDYTSVAIDPSDGSTFWVHNQSALLRGTPIEAIGPHEDGRWGTGFGSFAFPCTFSTSDITLNNDAGVCGAAVSFSPAFAGGCGAISSSPASGSLFEVGSTIVSVTGTRADSSTRSDDFTVTVVDVEAPTLTSPVASPAVLWPANQRMVDVELAYEAGDNCNGTCSVTVASNEAANGKGADWEVIDARRVRLRAARSGRGSGRVYTVTVTCKDAAGNETVKTTTVHVPHDSND
jgi:hypothetical protein